ncbi:MAG: ACT domain-containing protein [Terriglobales bacterium]
MGHGEHFMKLRFRHLPTTFAVCRLAPDTPFPASIADAPFISITRTAEELSIVCPASQVPQNAKCESPWTCFKLEGPFPFSLTGVLASFVDPLAQSAIPIFAISTFDTDYVLVKEESAASALKTLQAAGHELIS